MNNVCDDLAEAYSAIVRVDAFAYASRNTTIGHLSPEPPWIQSIRDEVGLLGGAGGKWQLDKPDIWSAILSPFKQYHALFVGTAEVSTDLADNVDAWLRLLEGLHQALINYRNATFTVEGQFTSHLKNLANIEAVLRGNLDQVWEELQKTETSMIALAAQITRLQDRLYQLQQNIDSAAVSNNWDFTKSAVSISYTLATAGGGIPYLAVAGMLYTVGKTAYDVIKNDAEISETIDQIVARRVDMSQETQAAAMTKAVIRLLYHFDVALARLGRTVPKIDRMWAAEADKVAQAMTALKAGARPGEVTELAAMRPALATWAQLAQFTDKISRGQTTGAPVMINIDQHTLEPA